MRTSCGPRSGAARSTRSRDSKFLPEMTRYACMVALRLAALAQTLGTSYTQDGQTYYEHCVHALAELDAAAAAVNTGQVLPMGVCGSARRCCSGAIASPG